MTAPDDPGVHHNLLADAAPQTRLPEDPVARLLADDTDTDAARAAVREHPESSLAWAVLAEQALATAEADDDVTAYAFARTGYHRGLDALRRSGWRGTGPVPWEHEPNRGFLRALWSLTVAAQRIGDEVEYERCRQFLADSSPTAYEVLSAG